MNVRIVGALAVLLAACGPLLAQGTAPESLPSSPAIAAPAAAPLGTPLPQVSTAPPFMSNGTMPPGPAPAPANGLAPEAYTPASGSNLCYAEGEYLLWKVRGFNIPDRVTSIPGGGLIAPVSFATQATFTQLRSDPSSMNGARVTLGMWGNPQHSIGLEAQALILERGTSDFGIDNSNQNARLTARTALSTATSLYGGEFNARGMCLKIGSLDFGWLAGVRYLAETDNLTVHSDARFIGLMPPLPNDLAVSTYDRIRIWNNYVGPQLGFDSVATFGGLYISARLKGSVGPNFQYAKLDGTSAIINRDPVNLSPASATIPGGLLVRSADVGHRNRTAFSFIPEADLKIGYNFCDWFRAHLGYDALYLGHFARPGLGIAVNSLSTTVTSPGGGGTVNSSDPSFRFRDHDIWVRGFNCGFELLF
jgi:hypothetical protein